jgi:hypothetical protein
MLGLGPGAHLTSKAYKRPPPEKFEAHNTILDLFTQGGLFAVFSFSWLLATTFIVGCRARLPALTTLVCSIGVFSMFHLIVRQPIFWFGIVLCLVEGTRTSTIRVGAVDMCFVAPLLPSGCRAACAWCPARTHTVGRQAGGSSQVDSIGEIPAKWATLFMPASADNRT